MADINGLVKKQATLVAYVDPVTKNIQKVTFGSNIQNISIDCLTALAAGNRVSFKVNADIDSPTDDTATVLHVNSTSFSEYFPGKIDYISICSNVNAVIQWYAR